MRVACAALQAATTRYYSRLLSPRSSVSDSLPPPPPGISISTTILTFDYGGKRVNLLDTPGHADFSEDTYRTLAAADQAVVLVDGGNGGGGGGHAPC